MNITNDLGKDYFFLLYYQIGVQARAYRPTLRWNLLKDSVVCYESSTGLCGRRMADDSSWYTKQPVGINTLSSMLKDISKDIGLSRIYTNHSVRSTTITALNEAGFETRVIMAVSGHRSEASVRSYCTDISQRQK